MLLEAMKAIQHLEAEITALRADPSAGRADPLHGKPPALRPPVWRLSRLGWDGRLAPRGRGRPSAARAPVVAPPVLRRRTRGPPAGRGAARERGAPRLHVTRGPGAAPGRPGTGHGPPHETAGPAAGRGRGR